MKPLCIYHGGCTDGIAAAWAVWKSNPNCEFYAGTYQNDPPYDKIDNASELIIVDFSYKKPIMESICDRIGGITVLDHHKTAKNDLRQLFGEKRIGGEFDMVRCGAMIAWDWYHSPNRRPKLLSEIDKNDRWLKDRDPQLIIALRSYPHAPKDDTQYAWHDLMRQWDDLMTDEGIARLRAEGSGIYRYYRLRVEETKAHSSPMTIGEFKNVPTVNAPDYLASDVANELAVNSGDGIAAVWWEVSNWQVTVSLRSRGDVDVGLLATQFGGGGHPGAAGFKVSFDQFQEMRCHPKASPHSQ